MMKIKMSKTAKQNVKTIFPKAKIERIENLYIIKINDLIFKDTTGAAVWRQAQDYIYKNKEFF